MKRSGTAADPMGGFSYVFSVIQAKRAYKAIKLFKQSLFKHVCRGQQGLPWPSPYSHTHEACKQSLLTLAEPVLARQFCRGAGV